MWTFLGRLWRWFTFPFRLAARRPILTGLVVVFILTATLFAGWWYAVSRWEKAQTALKEDRVREAREAAQFCLLIWPYSPEVHMLAARAARRSGDLTAAEGHLNRCKEIQGGATDAIQLEYLLIRVQAGEVDDLANGLFALVEQKHPDSREILDTVAHTYLVRLRYKPAYACLSKWIEVEPQNAKPLYWRGWTLERLNNPKAASTDYHKAIELDPTLVPARLRIAEMLLEDKQAPEALPHLELLVRQEPNNPQVQARLGICLFLQGRGAEARKLMEAAVAQLPNDAPLLVTLANLELQEGRGEAAEQWLRQVLKTDPSDIEALFVLTSALQLQQRPDEAAEVLAEYTRKREIVDRITDLLKDKADSPTATATDYAEIGSLFTQINRDKLSVYWLEKALEKDPLCQPAHRALSDFYEKKGDAAASDYHRRHLRPSDPPPPKPPTDKSPSGSKQP